ncbi:unnamed protein product [Schistocephalus solidus]|uniref:Uncharacterized protein n=1 Tax=Schistocephalus solidus TaxID=70667 RepID=A0A183SDI2_SCHSO|nr:unnamed protein product [Schistocephalus solidus]
MSRNTRNDDVAQRISKACQAFSRLQASIGYLDHLHEPSKEAESLPSQLPPQNTKTEMARQDPGYGSPGADRNPQHPRHAEASATAMERPPDSPTLTPGINSITPTIIETTPLYSSPVAPTTATTTAFAFTTAPPPPSAMGTLY